MYHWMRRSGTTGLPVSPRIEWLGKGRIKEIATDPATHARMVCRNPE